MISRALFMLLLNCVWKRQRLRLRGWVFDEKQTISWSFYCLVFDVLCLHCKEWTRRTRINLVLCPHCKEWIEPILIVKLRPHCKEWTRLVSITVRCPVPVCKEGHGRSNICQCALRPSVKKGAAGWILSTSTSLICQEVTTIWKSVKHHARLQRRAWPLKSIFYRIHFLPCSTDKTQKQIKKQYLRY